MLSGIHIGNLFFGNPIFLAPMAGVTDLPFRLLARDFGSCLCFTEMISAQGLVRKTHRSYEYLESSPGDRPLGVQLFGSEPDILSEAAAIVTERGADLIDINAGCPVKKVLKTGAGGALMRDPARFAAVVRGVRKATHLPLTVKIRSGWGPGEINAPDIAEVARECGVDALTLHPRTVKQGFGGSADWHLIGRVKERARIPVIGSGDVRNPEDARGMITTTGCDGVMVGRGALGAPWIFREITSFLSEGVIPPPPSPTERENVIHRHLEMNIRRYGEQAGVKGFRKHLLWYTKGLRGGGRFRKAAVSVEGMDELLAMVHTYLQSLQIDRQKVED